MSTRADLPDQPELPRGTGPLADPGAVSGGPIDDPVLTDRANPRWSDPSAPSPDAPPLGGPAADDPGTLEDQAAQPLEGQLEVGIDNIREGRGDVQANPALAEGGDNG